MALKKNMYNGALIIITPAESNEQMTLNIPFPIKGSKMIFFTNTKTIILQLPSYFVLSKIENSQE